MKNFLEKVEKGQQAENDKTERVTGLGRRTREAKAKWNQMTALRFQTGGRHQTSPASLRGLGVILFRCCKIRVKTCIMIVHSTHTQLRIRERHRN